MLLKGDLQVATTRLGGIFGMFRGHRLANISRLAVRAADPGLDVRSVRPLVLRLVALFAFTSIPFWTVFRGIAESVAGGSGLVYLIVVPMLVAVIAAGYRTPPVGVGDPESDWILAGLFGGLGLFLRQLMCNRFPTLSGLWELPLVGAVIWAACLAAVLFGVRRVMQMWALWIFAVATITPLPYLLLAAQLGGGVTGIAVTTGILAGTAVALAGRLAPLRWRAGVAVGTAALSTAAAMSAGTVETASARVLLMLITGGVIPVAGAIWLHGMAVADQPRSQSTLPRRSPFALTVLGVGAVVVLLLNLPLTTTESAPARAEVNWATNLRWPTGESFAFIQRYLGPHSTFIRYRVPSTAGLPEVAVDVITTDNLAALRTFRDAIWYPATVPPNYRNHDLGSTAIGDGRSTATDSALATSALADDWFLITWLWQTAATYQQIFVVVNQTWSSSSPPPVPDALSIRATIIGPALWLLRQQADPPAKVDPAVTTRAQQIVAEVLNAGMPYRE